MSETKFIVDKNLHVETSINEEDIAFFDVRKPPFCVYGLYNYKTEPVFKRLPDEVGQNVNSGVATLYLHTAGGRVRFSRLLPLGITEKERRCQKQTSSL